VHVIREQKDYVSLSFSTISAVGSNAAVIHYRFKLFSAASECFDVIRMDAYQLDCLFKSSHISGKIGAGFIANLAMGHYSAVQWPGVKPVTG